MRSLHLHHSLSLVLAFLFSLGTLFASQAGQLAPAASYQVNSNANLDDLNPGDGQCLTSAGTCTLVAAIQEANADGVNSRITFAQMFTGSNAFNGCVLPALTEDYTTIDASSQWDSVHDQPGVELGGLGVVCYLIAISGNNNTIQGLIFYGSSATGVRITGQNNVIGTGTQAGRGNAFATSIGLELVGQNNLITHNRIGIVNDASTCPAIGPVLGVLDYGGNQIDDNLIDCNGTGIDLHGSDTHVDRNTVGVDSYLTATRPNVDGIRLSGADGNTIDSNNIAGNNHYGIDLESSDDNIITNNQIGLTGASIGNGQYGIYVSNSSGNQIGQPAKGNSIYNNYSDGIYVASGSNTIQSNHFRYNGGSGITLRSDWNTIGGANPGEGNAIFENSSTGILLDGASHNDVYKNCIGFDDTCSATRGNHGTGILLRNGASSNHIGGAGLGNWIGNNLGSGIEIQDAASVQNYVQGNIVGAPAGIVWQAGNTLNGIRLYNGTAQNIIGGLGTGQGNIILGNLMSGLALDDSDSNWIFGNKIGTDGAGHNWGNTLFGIRINNGAASNIMLLNKIAYNGGTSGLPGIWVTGSGSISNPISTNSIFSHSGKGIELESGGNNELAAPAITIATCTVIGGQACPNCSIELYSDTHDEGERFLASTNADGSGAFAWSGPVMGPNVTALATDGSQNTSEFSAPYTVGACPAVYLPFISK